jgi:hypothetical protein
MNKDRKSLLQLIVVSLIIAAVLNFILGALLELSSDKTDTQVNSSSIQETIPATHVTPSTVQKPTSISSSQSAETLQPTPKPVPTFASISISISTSKAASTEDYQDAQWIANVQKHSVLLIKDIEEIGNTTSNLDSDTLATYGQYLIEDTQTAIEENNQYMVSPKCQDAQKEWGSALSDYSSAGKLMIQAAGAKNNDTNGNDIKQALSLIDSGYVHFKKVQESLKTAALNT